MKLNQILSLTISLSLISASSARADAIYVTNDLHDINLSQYDTRNQNYLYWKEAPNPGVLMSIDDFYYISGCLKSCQDLEVRGLDSLPKTAFVDPGPDLGTGIIYFVAGAITYGLISHFSSKH